MSDDIYIQIPAYRDRELLATLRDLLRTAQRPDRLRVAVAWQFDDDEAHLEEELRQNGRVELIKNRARQSQGCNWARDLLQQRWAGERFTLFLDSHHRFVAGWDERVVAMYHERRAAGVAKPIVTAYLPPYEPDRDLRTDSLFHIHLRERHEGLLFRLVGHEIKGWRNLRAPPPAQFASLHFLFADGSFNREVRFDPTIYFFADEVAVALRAYTHGYDLFHPHQVLGWHLYDRATRVTHWADHADWPARQAASCQRLRDLYAGRVVGPLGVGAARTVADYEAFIGMALIEGQG